MVPLRAPLGHYASHHLLGVAARVNFKLLDHPLLRFLEAIHTAVWLVSIGTAALAAAFALFKGIPPTWVVVAALATLVAFFISGQLLYWHFGYQPLRDAAIAVYSELKDTTGVGAFAKGYGASDDEVLDEVATAISMEVPIFGKQPPSTKVEQLQPAVFAQGHFVGGGAAFHLHGQQAPAYTSLSLHPRDVRAARGRISGNWQQVANAKPHTPGGKGWGARLHGDRPLLEVVGWLASIGAFVIGAWALFREPTPSPRSADSVSLTAREGAKASAPNDSKQSASSMKEPASAKSGATNALAEAIDAARQISALSDRDKELARLSKVGIERGDYAAALQAASHISSMASKDRALDLINCYAAYVGGDMGAAKSAIAMARSAAARDIMRKRISDVASTTAGQAPNDAPCPAL
jgi:hypothetical protein